MYKTEGVKLLIEKLLPDLYKIEIPLPDNPLKSINSYVIKSPGRNLIIDTGMNQKECMAVMDFSLKELDINLNKTDFFITHLHADHCGLVSKLAADNSNIYCSQQDADIINSTNFWDRIKKFALMSGFPQHEFRELVEKHPGYKYGNTRFIDFNILKEGDMIKIGEYIFKCIETPGHTKGHMCLYEPKKKIIITGDHVIKEITPNISLWSYEDNFLDDYLKSLDKVYELDVKLVLPGHRSIFRNLRERIKELKHHHQMRIDEILSILEKEKGERDAYQIASQMSWDLTYDSWEQFPSPQKWFATGEAASHLKYLEGKGMIRRKTKGNSICFFI